MRMIDSVLMELEQESATTRSLLERLPEDKLTWKPHPKSFSLGELALHIANLPGAAATAASKDAFEYAVPRPEARSRQEILDTLSRSMSTAKDLLSQMDDARVTSQWTLTSGGKPVMTIPRIAFIRSIMLNHWYHHRGQMTVYLRLLDVPLPSIYGPTADENPFGAV